MKIRRLFAAACLLGFACCNDDADSAQRDGGDEPDARVPSDATVPLDAGLDAALDAGRDAAADALVSASDARADADSAPACNASVAPALPPLALSTVVSGRTRLVYAAQAPGSSDWYLVQQTGRIDLLQDGMVRSTPFLDLSARFLQTPDDGDERGLLGLAFAPDYAASGKFYVALTPNNLDDPDLNRDLVLEYQRSAADPLVADVSTRKGIVRLDASAQNHNGGNVVFGPDGLLYVGTGDGGGGCNNDKPNAPQDPSSPFGKILRLDPRLAEPYAASGNPFAAGGGDPRVLHYGLRNPFRFGFDGETGDLYIGDVGQDSYEEVSFAPASARALNFGWAAYEGNVAGICPGRALRSGDTPTPPIVNVDRRSTATGDLKDYRSIIVGPVYRGRALPALEGALLFGDYAGVRMAALRQCGAQTSPLAIVRKRRDVNSTERYFALPAMQTFNELTAIVRDQEGELYFVANRSTLFKLVPGT